MPSTHTARKSGFVLIPIFVGLAAPLSCLADDAFLPLGGFDGSWVKDVTADGSVAVGGSGGQLVFWEAGESRVIPGLEGMTGGGLAISPEGAAVVGYTYISGNSGDRHPFLWLNGSVTDLGTLGGSDAVAVGVSANGSVVVGSSDLDGDQARHAFLWTRGEMTDLGALGGFQSFAEDVSDSGKVVVGWIDLDDDGTHHAFRWTEATGMVDLGAMAGGTFSRAYATSADGSVVVGAANQPGNLFADHAFRWSGNVFTDLGTLGGTSSRALGVSGDGLVVVGVADNASNDYRAFRWTQAGGMQDVADWLADAGVSVPAGWVLETAEGVNANGSVLVGSASSNFSDQYTAWLARVGSTESGLLTNIPVYNASVVESGSRGVTAGVALPSLVLFGAHHRSLLDSGLVRREGGACGWATMDAAGDNHTDTRAEVLEAGACMDVGPFRFGLGVGQDWARQDWTLGGGANMDGQHLVAEADYVFSSSLEGSLLGYYGRFDTDMRRHYMNGAVVDGSSGKPDAESLALRLRLDWKDVARLGGFGLSPYAAYTWSRTEQDAYTETGGGFPATFGATRWTVNDLRVGATAARKLDAMTDLRLGLELAHRFEGSTNGVNGSVIGLWDFSLPGQDVKQNWVRLLLDVDNRVSDNLLLTLGGSAASEGGDASWALTAGLRATF